VAFRVNATAAFYYWTAVTCSVVKRTKEQPSDAVSSALRSGGRAEGNQVEQEVWVTPARVLASCGLVDVSSSYALHTEVEPTTNESYSSGYFDFSVLVA
jgi:hypothetical protein